MADARMIVDVEVCLVPTCSAKFTAVEEIVKQFIIDKYLQTPEEHSFSNMEPNKPLVVDVRENPFLLASTRYVRISELANPLADMNGIDILVHVFQPYEDGGVTEMDDESDTAASQQWDLPAQDFEGYWESLLFDNNLKSNLLSYITTTMLFSSKLAISNEITCNRLILLHGPPGTGKTTLCKALAQKASIRFSKDYAQSLLIEVNAHSLFSKWFSESGKLVLKLFDRIREAVEDEETFVFVLIDEVESLTSARASAMNANEPSDAVRVVNALLTQIDRLSKYKNVLVLATTNITKAIDPAFLDRADFSVYVGLPSLNARYEIIRSCVQKLREVGFIENCPTTMPFAVARSLGGSGDMLMRVAEMTDGMSGRVLRKIPLVAHAEHLSGRRTFSLDAFLGALSLVAAQTLKDRSEMVK